MSELSDQKLFSARRSNGRPPNQPTATTITSRRAGQTPASAEANLLESLPNQIAATIGAIPRAKPGTTRRRVKATTSFGRLISASRLPASDKSERRLVLDASSSMSPRRGSMAGLKQLLRRPADYQYRAHDNPDRARGRRQCVRRFGAWFDIRAFLSHTPASNP